jgi:hypothetical protein
LLCPYLLPESGVAGWVMFCYGLLKPVPIISDVADVFDFLRRDDIHYHKIIKLIAVGPGIANYNLIELAIV